MADLSTAEGRIAAARRPTTNRDGILPQRRQTDLPNNVVTADMRSANRGDGGARELQKALGLLQDAAADFGRARETARADEYKGQAAAGALDATTGADANPAMSKSSAYQEAYYGAKAEREFRTFEATLKDDLQRRIDAGEDPASVQEFFQSQVAGFVEKTRDSVPVPSAQLATAGRLRELAGSLEVGVAKALKDRMDTDFIATVQTNIALDAKAGRPLEIERYIGTIRLTGKSAADAKKAVFDGVMAAAMDPDDPQPELLDELLASKQADGVTPSVSATERVQLLNAKITAEGLVERRERAVREEKQTAFYADLVSKWDAGEEVDVQALTKDAYDAGAFTPEEYMQASQALQGFTNFREEGDLNERASLQLMLDLSAMRSPSAKRARINADFKDGKLGTGTAAFRVYVQQMSMVNAEIEAEAKARASGGSTAVGGRSAWGIAEDAFEAQLKPKGTYDGVAVGGTRGVYQAYASARAEWLAAKAAGEDPFSALDRITKRYPNLAAGAGKDREGGSASGLGAILGGAPRSTAPRGTAANPIRLD